MGKTQGLALDLARCGHAQVVTEDGAGEAQAVASIRKLKALARDTGAVIWPNHDMAFYRRLPMFPGACE